MKDGYKTSEFWVTLLAIVLSLLVHVGLLSPDDSQTVQESGSSIVKELFDLLGSLGPVLSAGIYTYVRGLVKNGKS